MKTKEIEDPEEREGKHDWPWHLKIKLKWQWPNVCTPSQKHYYKPLTKKNTDEDNRMIAYLKFKNFVQNFIE